MSLTKEQEVEAERFRKLGDEISERVFGRVPKHTWFRPPSRERNGPMFGWLIEPFEGLYGSLVWVPTGKGSRSNDASTWQLEERLMAVHERRKDAKARALRLYKAYYDHGCSIKELIDGTYLDKIK